MLVPVVAHRLQSVVLVVVRRSCRVVVVVRRRLVVRLSIRHGCHKLMVICVGA